jgi:hypothetical protein
MQSPHTGIETEIENMRLRPILILKDGHSFGRNDLGYRIIGVPQVCQPASTKRAAIYAGRLHAFGNPVVAEIAFVSDLVFRMEEPDAIRASHDAIAAADAPFPVNENDTVVRLVGCANRANLDAGRIVTLITEFWNEKRLGHIFGLNFFTTNRA